MFKEQEITESEYQEMLDLYPFIPDSTRFSDDKKDHYIVELKNGEVFHLWHLQPSL